MKKIVFSTIPMQDIQPQIYSVNENKAIEYGKAVRIPMDGILAKVMKKGDEYKIVRVVTEGKFSNENLDLQKQELDAINSAIGAKIEYSDVIVPYSGLSKELEGRFGKLIAALEDNCEIYMDMTYSDKMWVPILFYVLGFAERFFNADIKNIIYGKITHNENKQSEAGSGEIFDMTPLFYLNSLTSVMEAPDSKTALTRLNKFFEM